MLCWAYFSTRIPSWVYRQRGRMALRFSTFEEIKKREDFDATCHVAPETLDQLIGPYNCPKEEPEEPCQVWKAKRAKRCDEHHRKGWLGRNKDGKEVLIGGNCASQEFHADEKFQEEVNRISAELEFLDLSRRYAEHRERPDLPYKLGDARTRLRRVEKAISNVNTILTDRTLRFLESMAKTGNTTVMIQTRRVVIEKVDGKDKERIFYDPHPLGSMRGVRFFGSPDYASILQGLDALEAALRELRDYEKPRPTKIKSTLKALEKFTDITDSLTRLEDVIADFLQEPNLRLLCFTSDEKGTREAIAQLYHIVKEDGAAELGEVSYHRSSCAGECARILARMDDEIIRSIAKQGFRVS